MQTYCVNTIGAACALVLVFPNTTMSGNPGNCGNACSCTQSVRNSRDKPDIRHVKTSFFLSFGKDNADLKKQCPAVLVSCVSCGGDPAGGCVAGANAGCPCTGVSFQEAAHPAPVGIPSLCPGRIDCSAYSCLGSGEPAVCSTWNAPGCPCETSIQGQAP